MQLTALLSLQFAHFLRTVNILHHAFDLCLRHDYGCWATSKFGGSRFFSQRRSAIDRVIEHTNADFFRRVLGTAILLILSIAHLLASGGLLCSGLGNDAKPRNQLRRRSPRFMGRVYDTSTNTICSVFASIPFFARRVSIDFV
jgi:hypothetical protein